MRTSRSSAPCGASRRPILGEPTRLLAEGDTIEVGDVCLQVIETPGHTPGGIVLFAATEQGNIAFVGDTLFPGQARPHRSFRRRRGGDSALALQARPASPARYRLPNRPWRFDHHGTRAHAEPVSCRCRLYSRLLKHEEASKRQAIFPQRVDFVGQTVKKCLFGRYS